MLAGFCEQVNHPNIRLVYNYQSVNTVLSIRYFLDTTIFASSSVHNFWLSCEALGGYIRALKNYFKFDHRLRRLFGYRKTPQQQYGKQEVFHTERDCITTPAQNEPIINLARFQEEFTRTPGSPPRLTYGPNSLRVYKSAPLDPLTLRSHVAPARKAHSICRSSDRCQ